MRALSRPISLSKFLERFTALLPVLTCLSLKSIRDKFIILYYRKYIQSIGCANLKNIHIIKYLG